MKFSVKKLTFFLLLFTSLSFSQSPYGGLAIDANYGISGVKDPGLSDFSHFDFGVRYMFNDLWGLKLDYGQDKFRTQETPTEEGIDISRISAQGYFNLTNIIDSRSYFYSRTFNLMGHAGVGYSMQKSVTIPEGGTDEIGHIIFGITPQFSITDNLAVGLDATGIIHLSQHYWFDGNYTYTSPEFNGSPNATTTFIYNLTLGLSYTFGQQ
ncbi:outer membrane beta-barrel protein [Flavobacterium sp.]|uniref:outer membrane beta-barrel protein n=1 Tax=Flavobacterium sp. TaxID=239 RepID=UPI0028BD7785|nr:outer membrane beta-barrel protein [Flavobacterium sp.]